MGCMICGGTADELGSHLIPASLISKCIGKRNREESYNIDSKTSKITVFYGRENLNNDSTEIKPHHYTRDNVLCKLCEKKLADLEGKFASEFLQKFREDKYKSNFISSFSMNKLEILEPKKLSNLEIQAYFYSIILRFCNTFKVEDKNSFIDEINLIKIKKFVYNFLYDLISIDNTGIEDFKIGIIFNKYSTNSGFISKIDTLKNPYTFYFCEAIVVLYIGETKDENKSLWFDCLNSITDETYKIIVGPLDMYEKLTQVKAYIFGQSFMTNGINHLTELNQKSYEENEIEVRKLIDSYEAKDDKGLYITHIFEDLIKKYTI